MSLTADHLNELCSRSYLDGLDSALVTELRERRDDCQRAEVVLSYLRRVLQGQMDLVLAEIEVRRHGGRSDPQRLIQELPTILASASPSPFEPNHVPVLTMPAVAEGMDLQQGISIDELVVGLTAEEPDGPIVPNELFSGANLCNLGDEELQRALAQLREHETRLSAKRRVLHEQIDAIQAAIVDRYKSGAANPDSLLS
jgi:hypothetical protein